MAQANYVVVKGCIEDIEFKRARKPYTCAHWGANHRLTVACAGAIAPSQTYARVRSGSWLDYEPVNIACLLASEIIRATPKL